MDGDNGIFLTVKISVLPIEKGSEINIKDLTIISNKKVKDVQDKGEYDTSSSEDERDGAKIREDFNFFKNVLKENGIKNSLESQSGLFNPDKDTEKSVNLSKIDKIKSVV
jgi:hypothetical protein